MYDLAFRNNNNIKHIWFTLSIGMYGLAFRNNNNINYTWYTLSIRMYGLALRNNNNINHTWYTLSIGMYVLVFRDFWYLSLSEDHNNLRQSTIKSEDRATANRSNLLLV